MDNNNQLNQLPEEVLELVVEKLGDSKDMLNLFKAYPRIGEMLQKKKGAWLFDQVVPSLAPWLTLKDNLACRQTCRRWHRVIEPSYPVATKEDAAVTRREMKTEWLGMLSYGRHNNREWKKLEQRLVKMSVVKCPEDLDPEAVPLNGKDWQKELYLEFATKQSMIWKTLDSDDLYRDHNTVVITFQDPKASDILAPLMNSNKWGGVIGNVGSAGSMLCRFMKVEYNKEENTFYGFVPSREGFIRQLNQVICKAVSDCFNSPDCGGTGATLRQIGIREIRELEVERGLVFFANELGRQGM